MAPVSKSSGGISRWTQHIKAYYESLNDRNIDLVFFDTARSEFIPDDIAIIPRLKLAIRDYRVIIRDFKQAMNEELFDVVHITSSAGLGLFRDLYMTRLARKKGSNSIIHFRFGRIPQLSKKRNWEWKLLSRVVKKADRVIVLDKRSYMSLLESGSRNVSLLPNMVSPNIEKTINNMKAETRVPRRLLFVGHCIATKGVYELVEACKSIQNIHLVLLGEIKEKVRRDLLNIADGGKWFEIMGEKPYAEVIRELLKCDVFILPTYTEGFPNVILEAMACGCAIVTTPVGAIPEMLEEENGRSFGLMVEPKNVLRLSEAIKRVLNDEQFKNECRINSRKRVNERYSMSKVWEQLTTIWNNMSKIIH